MEKELPKNWVETTLGTLNLPVSKVNPKNEPNKKFKYIDISSINSDNFKIEKPKHLRGVEAPSRARQLVHEGDIIVSTVRPYLKRIAKIDKNYHTQVASTGFAIIRLEKPLNSHFVFLYCLSDDFINGLIELQRGASYPAVRNSDVFAQKIPLPPLAEQKRIVAKLDGLFGHLERLKTRLDRIPALLANFRQSVLTQAVTGKLTEEWRVGKELGKWGEYLKTIETDINRPKISKINSNLGLNLPKARFVASLESLCYSNRAICYGVIKLGIEVEEGIKCLRTSDVKPLYINDKKIKTISHEIAYNYKRSFLKTKDILVNVRGTLGGVAVVPPEMEGYNISREIAIVPISRKIDSTWLSYYIASSFVQNWLSKVTRGNAYVGINIKDLKKLPIALPSLQEQKEIVRRVEALFCKADAIEARYAKLKAKITDLPQALLAKAFRGELLPQLPSDGDARDLLAEIQALRAEMGSKKRKKK